MKKSNLFGFEGGVDTPAQKKIYIFQDGRRISASEDYTVRAPLESGEARGVTLDDLSLEKGLYSIVYTEETHEESDGIRVWKSTIIPRARVRPGSEGGVVIQGDRFEESTAGEPDPAQLLRNRGIDAK